jgi:hypothetical protein
MREKIEEDPNQFYKHIIKVLIEFGYKQNPPRQRFNIIHHLRYINLP